MKQIGGATVESHLAVVRSRLGRDAKVDRPPPLPDEAQDVWIAFANLSGARQVGIMAQPISYTEIASYQTTTGIRLRPWEVDLIRRIDTLFMAEVFEEAKRKGRQK